jgi:hypothetical protein
MGWKCYREYRGKREDSSSGAILKNAILGKVLFLFHVLGCVHSRKKIEMLRITEALKLYSP